MQYTMYKKYRRGAQNRTDRIRVVAGSLQVGDTHAGKIIKGFGKTWNEGGESYQYAYFTERSEQAP